MCNDNVSARVLREQAKIRTTQARELRAFAARDKDGSEEYELRARNLDYAIKVLLRDADVIEDFVKRGAK